MTVALKALVIGWLALGLRAGEAHISPMVEFVPRARAVREILEDATAFYVREVRLGKTQLAELKARVGWAPEERTVQIFVGRDDGGEVVGYVLLLKSDSRHGPLHLAVGFHPAGSVSKVIITHATEETAPWVRALLAAGFLAEFEGRTESNLEGALESLEGRVGAMPRYMGRVTARGVRRAAALYAIASTV